MKAPASFQALCRGLHQDALLLAGDSMDRLASDCVGHVPRSQRQELRTYLTQALSTLTPAELKGQINREKTDLRLDSAASHAFLAAALAHLSP